MNKNINLIGKKISGIRKNVAKNNDIIKSKKIYDEFVTKMNKSDFCNSERRYIAELSYVRQLKLYYSKENCEDLLKEMTDRDNEIFQTLENEFGITLNE